MSWRAAEGMLAGKVAVVTGATAGIGEAVARTLSAHGAKVVPVGRNRKRLEGLTRELAAAGGEVFAVAADLRDDAQIVGIFESVAQRWGGVDILVNSAGLGHVASLVDGPSAFFQEMWQVNVQALAVATREAVRDMRRRGVDGHVVHVSSMSAYRVQPGAGMYAATKHAVRALTIGLRQELKALGSGIRVGAVSPGDVGTGFMDTMMAAAGGVYTPAPYPPLDPQDVAGAVMQILTAPPNVEVVDILMSPTRQPD